MAKVKVTEAEVMAAKLTIEINEKLGRETPEQIIRLANAAPAPHPAEASAS